MSSRALQRAQPLRLRLDFRERRVVFSGIGTYWDRTPLDFVSPGVPVTATVASPTFAG